MAHEVETMAYAGAVPWHGLGAPVPDNLTPEQMLSAAGLDWSVEKWPLVARTGEDEIAIPGRYALIRSTDKKVLSIITEHWNPVQNRDLLEFMRDYVAAGGAKLETAGSLKGGKIVWGLANIGHSFEVSPGDRVNGYLLITSSHEPGRATQVRSTAVRVVCANTLGLAERRGEATYSQTHFRAFDFNAARGRVAEAHEDLARCERQARTLQSIKIGTEDAVRKVLVPVFAAEQIDEPEKKLPRSITQILESVERAPGAEPGTAWGIMNGVTHWADHVSGRGADTRLTSAWVGINARRKSEVAERLLELAD